MANSLPEPLYVVYNCLFIIVHHLICIHSHMKIDLSLVPLQNIVYKSAKILLYDFAIFSLDLYGFDLMLMIIMTFKDM